MLGVCHASALHGVHKRVTHRCTIGTQHWHVVTGRLCAVSKSAMTDDASKWVEYMNTKVFGREAK